MASLLATEQPTIDRAWRALVLHGPTILLIWVATLVIQFLGSSVYFRIAGDGDDVFAFAIGLLGQLPFSILSSLVGLLFVAVPAFFYEHGDVIDVSMARKVLMRRWWRYLLAGLLFSIVSAMGFVLCVVPGIAVVLVMPVYVNRIFVTDLPIVTAFSKSFRAVYGSPHGFGFVGLEILVWMMVMSVSVFTFGLGALLAVPVSAFYLQNSAYHKGLIS